MGYDDGHSGAPSEEGPPRDQAAPNLNSRWEEPRTDATWAQGTPSTLYGPPHYTFAPPPAYPPPAYPPPYYPVPYGNPYAYLYPYPYYYPPRPANPTFPVIGGLLSITSGVLTFIFVAVMGAQGSILAVTQSCLAIAVVFGTISIIGGLCAVSRRLLPMAILGAIFSMLCFFTWGMGFVLGIIALVLIAVGHDAFVPMGVTGVPPRMPPPPPPYR